MLKDVNYERICSRDIADVVCKQGKIVAAMFEGNYRTTEECDEIHAKIKTSRNSKVKVGPVSFEVPMSVVLITVIPTILICGSVACASILSKIQNGL